MNKWGRNFWNGTIILSDGAKRYHDVETICSPFECYSIDITLFISCYNEEAYIIDTLNTIVSAMQVVGKTYEIIVIDDGSKDNSVDLVKTFIREHPEINFILRVNDKNKGLAQNFVDGAFIGKGKYYRLICGDNAEPKETIIEVLNMMGEADIIVPYYVSAEGKSRFRRTVSKVYTLLINFVSGNKIYYYNGLQVHLRHNVMRWHPNTRGFGFQAGLLCLLLEMGFTYKQIPCVTVEKRDGGGNAITWKNLRSVMHVMMSILLRRIAPWA